MPKYNISDIIEFQPSDWDGKLYYLVLNIKYNTKELIHPHHYVFMDLTTGSIYETHFLNIRKFESLTELVA